MHPEPGFLEGVRELCHACGAVLVFDEITVGWRMALGGAHLHYGVSPDIAVFAKALGNGHPIGAIIRPWPNHASGATTFISSTYWTEGVGPTAALATICKLDRANAPAHLRDLRERMRAGWQELGRKHGVPVKVTGHPAILSLGFDHADAAALGTLVTTRMLDHGFLTGTGFYPSLAHEPRHVDAYLTAADDVFAEVGRAIHRNDIQSRLAGPVRHTGFARLA